MRSRQVLKKIIPVEDAVSVLQDEAERNLTHGQ